MMFENPDQIPVEVALRVQQGLADHPFVAEIVGILMATVPLVTIFALFFAFTTWLERKGLARIQNRIGPNRVGPFGLFQPIADGIKMMVKEDFTPPFVDKWVYNLAPWFAVVPVLVMTLRRSSTRCRLVASTWCPSAAL